MTDASKQSETPGDGFLLRTVDLTRHFSLGGMFSKQVLHAVDDVNLAIGEREIVALVGESGSGKSTVARLLARIYRPTGGEIFYRGRPFEPLRSRKELSGIAVRSDRPPGSVQRLQPGVPDLARGDAQPRVAQAGAESRRAPARRPSG